MMLCSALPHLITGKNECLAINYEYGPRLGGTNPAR
uniref:Uncharacterized protein n=1 Tax=Candidatus Nitrotoga fabula TaxID=2182327 RepID=A0A2X0QR51_9PROT|nr:protein of unknown function [Candidatus Nitrotoga fabula]